MISPTAPDFSTVGTPGATASSGPRAAATKKSATRFGKWREWGLSANRRIDMVQRPMTMTKTGSKLDRPPHIVPCAGDSLFQGHVLGDAGGDGGSERAARAVGAGAVDLVALKAYGSFGADQQVYQPARR